MVIRDNHKDISWEKVEKMSSLQINIQLSLEKMENLKYVMIIMELSHTRK